MAAAAEISSSLCRYSSVHDISASTAAKTVSYACRPPKFGTSFAAGPPFWQWFECMHGRPAMVDFAAAITVGITTGKGLLENLGLTTRLPTRALALTALAGVLTAVFIFQSASEN